MNRFFIGIVWSTLWFACIPEVSAASFEFIDIEDIYTAFPETLALKPHAISVMTSQQRFGSLPANTHNSLQNYFVYQTRVKIDGTVYYRVSLGEFESESDAKTALGKLKPTFKNAWVYKRSKAERKKLESLANDPGSKQAVEGAQQRSDSGDELLARARQAFLDEDYARVITLADRVVQTGNLEQVRSALELAGNARERQTRFTQAIVLYEALLDTNPPSEVSTRVLNRMEGIRTMSIEPRARLENRNSKADDSDWVFRGGMQQYYLNAVIDRPGESAETVNEVFVTDVNLQVQRRTDDETISFQVDAALINDFIEDQTDSNVSEASLSYAESKFRIIGGRQYRTVTGVNGRFDGLTFSDVSRPEYQTSYFVGNLAQSTYDSPESDNPLIGANLDFSPYDWFDVTLYAIEQEVSGLTDRQAIGSEFQLQNDIGFIYGIVDYDVFYEEWNNLTFISNYRYDQQWTFNLNLSRLNSMLLSTENALQGQAAESIDELRDTFSRDEIYQLAEDRTSKSTSLYFGTIYTIDSNRQLNLDLSIYDMDSVKASGGVDEIPSSTDTVLSTDYSVSGFFSARDYSSIGLRISELANSDIQSIRLRSRFPGYWGLVYDSRMQLDHRKSKNNGIDQYILRPAIKLKYRITRKLEFETDLGIEYSDLDLPDHEDQIAYSLFLGYTYFF